VKKRLVTLAAGAAILAAAAVPTGSAFAKKPPKPPSAAAKALHCSVIQSEITELTAEKAATADLDEKALLQALITSEQAKFVALAC
jgi:hypothetical protein